ncbi:MAG: hypothetical protein JW881_10535 [Spirochaetales bacterium]|nr:hypothetical protein [Spirochaetales bacterium]
MKQTITAFSRAKRLRFMVFFVMVFLTVVPELYGNIIIDGGLTHEKETPAGISYKGMIEVLNKGDKPQEIKIYKTDYEFFADGKVNYGEAGKLSRSNASWITVSPQRVTIPPNQTIPVYYTVNVPDDATLNGTYWSIVMVEPISESSPESSAAGDAIVSFGVQQILRYGIQLVTHIQGTGEKNISFLNPRFVKKESEKVLQVDIENTGTLWVKPDVWVELYDSKGVFVGKFTATKKRIYPGLSGRYTIYFTDMPSETYKALVIADCGDDDIFGMNLNLVIK